MTESAILLYLRQGRACPARTPKGPKEGDRKVLRGGSWEDEPRRIRVTARATAEPDFSDLTIGFRCAQDIDKK